MKEISVNIPVSFAVEEAADLRESINNEIEKGNYNFNFNFSQCKFIDSTGLGVLVSVYKKCAELKGSIKLYSLNSDVRKLFSLTRLDQVFEIH